MSWEIVSPETWIGALAMEEALMGGSSLTPMVTIVRILPSSDEELEEEEQSQGEVQEQQPTRGEETMKEAAEEGEEEEDEDDFFADLPLGARGLETVMPEGLAPPGQTKDGYSYYAYSYSTCTTLDDQVRRVNSTRRRYEDSAGRLKAVHLRKLGEQNLESTWMRASADEQGRHTKRVSSGDEESFEAAWKKTPFGIAHQQAMAGVESKAQRVFRDESPTRELP